MKKMIITTAILVLSAVRAFAGDEAPTPFTNKEAIDLVQSHADYVWTMVAAALVFFMQAGFALVETGFTRAKNRDLRRQGGSYSYCFVASPH